MKREQKFEEWQLNAGASVEGLHTLASSLSCTLPMDYQDFLRDHDGGEGFLGENYLILWRAEELVSFNREYEVDLYAPGLLLFGSDGGGEGYAFDTRSAAMPIVRVPFIGMDLQYALPVATSFTDLLTQLAS